MHKPKPNKYTGQSAPNQQHRETEECKVRGDIHARGEIEVDLSKSLIGEHKAERKEDDARQKKNYRVSLLTLIAVGIYALLTFWQGFLTRESLKATREYFQRDQRPYVFANHIDPAGLAAHLLAAKVYYLNYGKSPAMRVTRAGEILLGDTAAKQADDWFKQVAERDHSQAPWFVGEGVVPPGDTSNPVTTIITSRTPADSENVPYIVVMHIQYFDTFGVSYWSDICWWHLIPNMKTTYCPNHNEIH
jgi:hypothetical protein